MVTFLKATIPCVLGAFMCAAQPSVADESPIQNRFRVDIYCRDGRLDHTGTSNMITVSFYNGERLLYQDRNPRYADHHRDQFVDTPGATGAPGNCDNEFKGSFRYPRHVDETLSVTKIRMETNGEDALWMDFVELKELEVRKSQDVIGIVSYEVFDSNDPVATWGRRGGKGYCLSMDPYDGTGTWEPYVDRCVPWIEFHVEGERALAPKVAIEPRR